MRRRIALVGLITVIGLWAGADLLACGEKFLAVVPEGEDHERVAALVREARERIVKR